MQERTEAIEVAVIGGGAAGLMAGFAASRAAPGRRVVVFEGRPKVGAKILVSGGGRCNVTNVRVVAKDFAGSPSRQVDRVLRRFSVARAREFFEARGVRLKEEARGKLFPVGDKARVVVEALLGALGEAGGEVRPGWRVDRIEPVEGRFEVRAGGRSVSARRVIVCTGGKALPKSGSDGWGLGELARLGVPVTPRITPALVPLLLEAGFPLLELAGVAVPAELRVRAGAGGRVLARAEGPCLVTHVGLSGPAALDISRHWLAARSEHPEVSLEAQWWPGRSPEEIDQALRDVPARSLVRVLAEATTRRFAEGLLSRAGLGPTTDAGVLPKATRRRLVATLAAERLPVTGDQGFRKAEVTAGGVPLAAVSLKTLESKDRPGLHLAGEVLDVDGRLGGFNFQWAWASGWVAGEAAGAGAA